MTYSAQAAGPAVFCNELTRLFDGRAALDKFDLEVNRGEMFGLVGPDSAGKSTLIRILVGLLKPSGGEVQVLGFDIRSQLDQVKDRIGYLSQAFTLYGDLTVDENITFFADIHGVKHSEDRRDELLRMTDLTPFRRRLAQNLSGGMKKKLALVCTLIHQPDLIFLDEPSTGVDPVSRGEFWNILSRMVHDGLTVVLTTPYLDEAERCSRIALMHSGSVMMAATPDEVRHRLHGRIYSIQCSNPDEAYRRIREQWSNAQLVQYSNHLRLWLPEGSDQTTQWFKAGHCENASVEEVTPTLEDAFVGLITEVDGKENTNEAKLPTDNSMPAV